MPIGPVSLVGEGLHLFLLFSCCRRPENRQTQLMKSEEKSQESDCFSAI